MRYEITKKAQKKGRQSDNVMEEWARHDDFFDPADSQPNRVGNTKK